jgi:hypothetical protein
VTPSSTRTAWRRPGNSSACPVSKWRQVELGLAGGSVPGDHTWARKEVDRMSDVLRFYQDQFHAPNYEPLDDS